jgi:2-keto-3-deoxy-L-rhamnonate aldolase RhmA
MKSPSLERFRRKLATGAPLYGLWVTLEAAAVTDIAAGLGLDWVVIDAEHSHLDWGEILEHVRATVRSDTVALVCLSEASPGLIKRALDIGADGVVVPGVETVSQLRSIVKWARHVPHGTRSISNERATCWGHCAAEHQRESNANVLVVPIIETARAKRNIGALLNVDGAEVFFFHPADYAASLGEARNAEGTAFTAAHDGIVRKIRKRGKHAGIVAPSRGILGPYRDGGFSLLGLGFDGDIILSGIRDMLATVGKPVHVEPTFAPSRAAQMPTTGSGGLPK